jgi:hypothetical protein
VIVGHLAVVAAVHRWRPRVSLWWLVPAAFAPDLVDVGFALTGHCNPYGLYSHTIPAALLAGACVAGAAFLLGRREAAALMLLLVLLHLPPDLVTGRKLYWPGGELHGLAMYRRPMLDFVVESVAAIAGWSLLRRETTTPRWAASVWTLLAFLLVQGAIDGLSVMKPSACIAGPAAVPEGSRL